MRKALELTIYPRRGRETYVLPPPRLSLGAVAVDRLSEVKRFTDAELAAEFHAARMTTRVRVARVDNHPGEKTLFDHYERGLEQEWVLERFAMHPHYDEVSDGR